MNEKDIFRQYLLEEDKDQKPQITAAESLQNLRLRIGQNSKLNVRPVALSRYIGVAAAATIVGVFAVKYVSHTQTIQSPAKIYTTTPGQRARITLSDGSGVILAPATKLVVRDRNLELNGEAVFTVTQRKDNPFTVKTGNTVTRVIGTTFGVRKYATDSDVRVIVAEGKVSVDNTVLSIGEVAHVNQQGLVKRERNADIAATIGWTQGLLVFHDTPVREALIELERWYGLQFRLESPNSDLILTRQVNGTLESTPRTALIPLISDLLGVRAEMKGQIVILKEK